MRYSLEDIAKMFVSACALFVAMYVVYWFVVGFGTLAPGDFPWEDVFPWPVDEAFYRASYTFETIRDCVIGG